MMPDMGGPAAGMGRPSPAYSALGPAGGPGGPPPQAGPGAPGGPDPLAEALARLNAQLQGAIEGQVDITPAAENQLKVTIVLIQQLAQKEQQRNAPAPGGPMSQAGPEPSPAPGPPGGGA